MARPHHSRVGYRLTFPHPWNTIGTEHPAATSGSLLVTLIWFLATFVFLVGLIALGRILASTGCAYKAKILSSAVFVSGRQPAEILASDVGADDLSILRRFSCQVDHRTKRVTVTLWGLARRTAVFRDHGGCALEYGGVTAVNRVPSQPFHRISERQASSTSGTTSIERAATSGTLDLRLMDEAINAAFEEPSGSRRRRTRAVVVLHQDRLVAERYADGFAPETPLLGWSMAKTVINALAGILVGQGRLSLSAELPQSFWQNHSDPRRSITLDHLLRMTSGLEFHEDYGNPFKDVIRMLLCNPDAAGYAANKPLKTVPGAVWHYSSGNTNIISRVMREAIGNEREYLTFPDQALFGPLGLERAVLETDSSGTFVGSSFMYATARDWARFGALYLHDGLCEQRRILPEGWVAYSTTQTPQAPDACYGAHLWLKVPREFRTADQEARALPPAWHAVGYEGQFISIVPSHQLVVVRLGLTRRLGAWDHETFLRDILLAVPSRS